MSDPDEISWELLSYLALEPSRQEKLIGSAQEWFCKEDPRINPGANYLLGVVYAFSGYRNGFIDSAEPDNAPVHELDSQLKSMVADESAYFWTVEQLHESFAWRKVRQLAAQALASAGLESNPPSKPFNLLELLEVDGYPMKALPAV